MSRIDLSLYPIDLYQNDFYRNNQFLVTKLLFTKTDNSPLKLATAIKKSRDYPCKCEGTHHA